MYVKNRIMIIATHLRCSVIQTIEWFHSNCSFGIVNKCNEVLTVTQGKISVLETYRDVRYAYKILERDKNALGTNGNLVERSWWGEYRRVG